MQAFVEGGRLANGWTDDGVRAAGDRAENIALARYANLLLIIRAGMAFKNGQSVGRTGARSEKNSGKDAA